ncbi:MAG TPA: rod shape-determining protein MreC [Methylomirabilota bacterium]|nr:rod shape-determining protein MreC [Methylomirabilota bacterium]
MSRNKHYVALGSVTLATLLVLNLPSQAASRLKMGVGSLFLPLFALAGSAQQLPGKAIDAALPRSQLLKEIENLRQENQQLKVQQLQANAALQENNSLRTQVGWAQQQPWKLEASQVVLRDPANWWRTIWIDKGTRNGIRDNCPVLTSDGLVGRVSSAGTYRSQVILLGDPNCRVSARVTNPAHDIGILTASGPLDNSLLNLTYLSSSAVVKSGQQVTTSGAGGIFPAGIPIGQIADAEKKEFGLYTEARVKLSANLGALKEVWVLTNPQLP